MSENFSAFGSNSVNGNISTDEIISRLRNISFSGETDSSVAFPQSVSSASQFSRDALKSVPEPIQKDSSVSPFHMPDFEPASYTENDFSGYDLNIESRLNRSFLTDSAGFLGNYTPCFQDFGDYNSFKSFNERKRAETYRETIPPMNESPVYPVQKTVSDTQSNQTAETMEEPTGETVVTEAVSGKNPFAQLAGKKNCVHEGTIEKKQSLKKNPLCDWNGWYASIRCFGILGVLVGGGLLTFTTCTNSATHEITALGLSLLIAGISMFTSVGALNTFHPLLKED